MIGCLRTRVRKQQIIALYFESENEPRGLFILPIGVTALKRHDRLIAICASGDGDEWVCHLIDHYFRFLNNY